MNSFLRIASLGLLLVACSSGEESETSEDTGALESNPTTAAVDYVSATCEADGNSRLVVYRDRSCFYACTVSLIGGGSRTVRTLNIGTYASTQKGEPNARPCLGEYITRATPKTDDQSDRAEFTRTKFTITSKGAISYAAAMPLEVAPNKRETFARPTSDTYLAGKIKNLIQPIAPFTPSDDM